MLKSILDGIVNLATNISEGFINIINIIKEGFQNIIEFIQTIINTINMIMNNTLKTIHYINEALPKLWQMISTLPDFVLIVARITIFLSIMFLILGREHGKSEN